MIIIPILALGLMGWALATLFAVLAWRNWSRVGEWRNQAELCERRLNECMRRYSMVRDIPWDSDEITPIDPTLPPESDLLE